MSSFTQVDTWVKTNLLSTQDASSITPLLLKELQSLADDEPEKLLAGQAFNAMQHYRGDDQMRALSALRLPNSDIKTNKHMDNAFALVLLKSAPHSTDGIFVILQCVPTQYVLKTIIRCDHEYNVISITHTMFSMYETNFTKQKILTSVHGGTTQADIYELKRKYDNYERIKEITLGDNEEFKLTLPDGTTVIP